MLPICCWKGQGTLGQGVLLKHWAFSVFYLKMPKNQSQMLNWRPSSSHSHYIVSFTVSEQRNWPSHSLGHVDYTPEVILVFHPPASQCFFFYNYFSFSILFPHSNMLQVKKTVMYHIIAVKKAKREFTLHFPVPQTGFACASIPPNILSLCCQNQKCL